MATKITDLTELTSVAQDDLLVIVDTNTSTTKKVTVSNAGAAINTDAAVKVSSNDTTSGDLETKLLAGKGLSATTQNDGGNETRTLNTTLDVALSSDHSYDGKTIQFSAGEAVALFEIACCQSDAKFHLADADTEITMPAVALCVEAGGIASNASGTWLEDGTVRDDSWSWTPGGLLYASTTAGALTQTPPNGSGDLRQVVGRAITATIIRFKPVPILGGVA